MPKTNIVPKILWSAGANKSARDSRPHANRNCRAEIGRANKSRRRKIPLPSPKTQLFVRETFTGSMLLDDASRTVSILDDEESSDSLVWKKGKKKRKKETNLEYLYTRVIGGFLEGIIQNSHPLLFLNKVPSIIFSFYPCFSYHRYR